MQLSQKGKFFSNFFFFFPFAKFRVNFAHSRRKYDPHSCRIFELMDSEKTWLDKCLKSPVSEDPSTSNMGNGWKHC